VLVVDGQALFQAALGGLLAGPPLLASVRSCHRSDQALEWALAEHFDLVFCDVRAEPMSGPLLAKRLAGATHPVRTVLLADAAEERLLMSTLDCGAAGFFTKDSSVEEFMAGRGGDLARSLCALQPVGRAGASAAQLGGWPARRNQPALAR